MERFTYRDEKGFTRPTKIAEKLLEPDDGSNACRLLSKIGQYEDELESYKKLEEELGCPLEIRCKLYNNMDIVTDDGFMIIKRLYPDCLIAASEYDFKEIKFPYKDYKKTWWLKIDKSE